MRIFDGVTIKNIDLILSEYQKEMIETASSIYTANDRDYAGSDGHNSKEFLGYENFKSITCRYTVE